ncbi:MAG: hypothetical protein IT450_23660 [Phycisphaerales bacterium]|nr:hypothetical protein [Phycisphaerales bacterium]
MNDETTRVLARAGRTPRTRRGMTTRDGIMAAAAVVLLGVAGWYMWMYGGGGETIPNDSSTWVNFRCEGCKADFHLGARDLDTALRTKGMTAPASEGSRDLLFKCPKCGEIKGRQVN